jgi:hypothetical protein
MTGSTNYRVGVRIDGTAAGLARAAEDARRHLRALGVSSTTEFQRMAKAREVLGVRSEREVQREMQRTEAAYNRLARSGKLSWNEQRLAAQKMREEVTKLTNEMGRYTARQKIAMGFKATAAVGAGVGVATALAAPKVQKALDYDVRIAHLANTAFSDKGVNDRRAGMADINAMIVDAVRQGGGTRDSAVTTAEALFGAGVFKPGEIKAILREAVKAGTASNADPAAFAQMAITAKQTFGIDPTKSPDAMKRLFGIGTFAGQAGGFEIKDMARWLPQQMAAAKAVGMSGETGFAKLAALNQAAITTAGTRDEAGNNVVNLLAKIGSQDTVKDFKKQGVNLPKELAEGRMKGLDALDVVGNLLQAQLAKDKNFQQVQRQLADAKDDKSRKAALESVGDIAQGTVIGKVFQDRQALMGLYGYMNQRDRVQSIADKSLQSTDASQKNFDLISSTAGFKVEQRKEETEIAMQTSMDKLTPTIGFLNEKVTGLIREYPGYTTAIIGATGALIAFAGSAAAMALLNGGKLGGLGKLAGLGSALPGVGAVAGVAKAAGAVGLAGAAGYGAGTLLYKGALEGNAGGNVIGRGVANVASFFGSKSAEEALRAEERLDRANAGTTVPRAAAVVPAAVASPAVPMFSSPQPQAAAGGYPLLGAPRAAMAPQIEVPRTAGDRMRAGAPQSLADRLGTGTSSLQLQQELKGEITVKVTGAPGLNVQAEAKTNNPRVPMRASMGQSMNGSGF